MLVEMNRSVPHLQRSDPLRDWCTQPFRAGLTFGGRPSGPRMPKKTVILDDKMSQDSPT